MSGPPLLLPQHADRIFRESSISKAVAGARGYRSVTVRADLQRLGFAPSQRIVPALLIPVHNVQGEIGLYQIRPDVPRIGKDGKPVKYDFPKGAQMALDVHPFALPWVKDPKIPLFITEAVRKGDAGVSRGYCWIALLGVWNWRGTNEFGGKLALPDWELIVLGGRLVYLVFDSDILTKPNVHKALARLKAFLESRHAHVSIIRLPGGPGGAKVGADDFFAAGKSIDDMLLLATDELPPPPPDEDDAPSSSFVDTPGGIVHVRLTREGLSRELVTNFSARIVTEVIEDDGAGEASHIEIEARLGERAGRIVIPAGKLGAVDQWALEALGPAAIVSAGFGVRDRAREAVQRLSTEIATRRVFTHTGWRTIDGQRVFLHAGDCGPIGPDGPVIREGESLSVALRDTLSLFALPAPPKGDELRQAVRASLAVLDVAPDSVTFPSHAAPFRAVLGDADFSVVLVGPTGERKSELAALEQQHFGKEMVRLRLPANWTSTDNALEDLLFLGKDVLIVIDDFVPRGGAPDVARLHQKAERVLRAQGNHSARQRLRADTSQRPARPPRGLVLVTAEDLPRGVSTLARTVLVDIGKGAVNLNRLTQLQKYAADGLFAAAMAAFIKHVAQNGERHSALVREAVAAARARKARPGEHGRTPDAIASLKVGMTAFLDFALEVGAITAEESESLRSRSDAAFAAIETAQARHHVAADPARRFLELVAACFRSGRAHATATDGTGIPGDPAAWGWRQEGGQSWRPCGEHVGWIEDQNLYLDPETALGAAQRLARDQGAEGVTVSLETLNKRLHEAGLLASIEKDNEGLRYAIRKRLGGVRQRVLHIHASSLSCEKPVPPVPPGHGPTDDTGAGGRSGPDGPEERRGDSALGTAEAQRGKGIGDEEEARRREPSPIGAEGNAAETSEPDGPERERPRALNIPLESPSSGKPVQPVPAVPCSNRAGDSRSVVPGSDRNNKPSPTPPDISPPPAVLLRLGGQLGYPSLRLFPHLAVAAGKTFWETFAATSNPEDIQLALQKARQILTVPTGSGAGGDSHG